MKKVYCDKIVNIPNTDVFDNRFLYEYLVWKKPQEREIFFMSEEGEKYKNTAFLEKIKEKPAMWGNVYSPENELKIFKDLYEYALTNNKKIHIVGVTLGEEIEILEVYYEKL